MFEFDMISGSLYEELVDNSECGAESISVSDEFSADKVPAINRHLKQN